MMIALKHYPSNEEMDCIAFEHGNAIHMSRIDYTDDIVVTTFLDVEDYKQLGWIVRSNISKDNFQGCVGFDGW